MAAVLDAEELEKKLNRENLEIIESPIILNYR